MSLWRKNFQNIFQQIGRMASKCYTSIFLQTKLHTYLIYSSFSINNRRQTAHTRFSVWIFFGERLLSQFHWIENFWCKYLILLIFKVNRMVSKHWSLFVVALSLCCHPKAKANAHVLIIECKIPRQQLRTVFHSNLNGISDNDNNSNGIRYP